MPCPDCVPSVLVGVAAASFFMTAVVVPMRVFIFVVVCCSYWQAQHLAEIVAHLDDFSTWFY